jgi:hypothetical protein
MAALVTQAAPDTTATERLQDQVAVLPQGYLLLNGLGDRPLRRPL